MNIFRFLKAVFTIMIRVRFNFDSTVTWLQTNFWLTAAVKMNVLVFHCRLSNGRRAVRLQLNQIPIVAVTVASLGQFFLQGAPWSWKVVEFPKTIFQAWKVMENDDNVMEFLLLHWAIL